MAQTIELTVNGKKEALAVEPHLTLLEVLRDSLNLTGTKEGCSTGHCGACTVLVNGEPVSSCLLLAVEADGQAVTTVEGLACNGNLHPVQAAFIEKGGLQCGYCTSGMMLATVALLAHNAQPSEQEIRLALAGNLCRCTGYTKIVEAVQQAAEEMQLAAQEVQHGD
ncbi:MAG: (2Fe-2S)-binding protein [Chloroflexi bacterium]|nr:(2Fe-2S)-binding protein [Chloroflexota bacterium]